MGLVDTAKDLVELVQKADNIDLLRKVLQLQQDALEQQETIQGLTHELREAKARLAQREEMRWDQNVYWRGDGEGREGPFCPKCFHDQAPRVVPMAAGHHVWHCPACGYQQATPERIRELEAFLEAERHRSPEPSWLGSRR